jgi:hypothetical protein
LLARLTPYTTKAITLKQRSHKRRCTIRPLDGWLTKDFDEKRGNPKTQGLRKRHPMKKRGNPKMQGDKKKTSDEKRGNLKRKGLRKMTSDGKRDNLKIQKAKKKTSGKKRQFKNTPIKLKNKQDHQFTKASFVVRRSKVRVTLFGSAVIGCES